MIRGYFNLNVSDNLNHFDGPVLFIRRLRDEIINTNDSDPFRTNRGNDLLMKLLNNRFPRLMAEQKVRETLLEWLHSEPMARLHIKHKFNVTEDCLALFRSYVQSVDGDGQTSYPLLIGDDQNMSIESKIQLVLYLVSISSNNCSNL